MSTRFVSRALVLALLLCSVCSVVVALENAQDSLVVRESEIHECPSVEKLSALKIAVEDEESPIMRQVFAWLFPFGPGWNSVLGTFYISSVPNIILAFIPAEIHPDTLNTMTAFATGGLLSDVFLHLVPHAFMGEHQDPGAHFVMVEEKRNILIGIFVGFATFFEGHGHSHDHSHTHSKAATISTDSVQASGASTSLSPDGLRSRGSGKQNEVDRQAYVEQAHAATAPSKLSAYLNLFGDFRLLHSHALPHEIPHEIADYSILVRSGFTKKQAMQSQFLTAIGAFVSTYHTFMGIAIHNLSASGTITESLDLAAGVRQDASGILGTTVQPADLVIPFVAGGFMYIGAVAVLPTLLAESKSGAQALREFGAMAFGVLCMFFVAWNE
ncbi:ZIP-like iron-zinc transporter [Suillus cothurnatus]|nr:ZIP-like iron-zinc transporter [Suillus cothurnatus]